jgi:hypothetical protein
MNWNLLENYFREMASTTKGISKDKIKPIREPARDLGE